MSSVMTEPAAMITLSGLTGSPAPAPPKIVQILAHVEGEEGARLITIGEKYTGPDCTAFAVVAIVGGRAMVYPIEIGTDFRMFQQMIEEHTV